MCAKFYMVVTIVTVLLVIVTGSEGSSQGLNGVTGSGHGGGGSGSDRNINQIRAWPMSASSGSDTSSPSASSKKSDRSSSPAAGNSQEQLVLTNSLHPVTTQNGDVLEVGDTSLESSRSFGVTNGGQLLPPVSPFMFANSMRRRATRKGSGRNGGGSGRGGPTPLVSASDKTTANSANSPRDLRSRLYDIPQIGEF